MGPGSQNKSTLFPEGCVLLSKRHSQPPGTVMTFHDAKMCSLFGLHCPCGRQVGGTGSDCFQSACVDLRACFCSLLGLPTSLLSTAGGSPAKRGKQWEARLSPAVVSKCEDATDKDIKVSAEVCIDCPCKALCSAEQDNVGSNSS